MLAAYLLQVRKLSSSRSPHLLLVIVDNMLPCLLAYVMNLESRITSYRVLLEIKSRSTLQTGTQLGGLGLRKPFDLITVGLANLYCRLTKEPCSIWAAILESPNIDSHRGNPSPTGSGGLIRDNHGRWIVGYKRNLETNTNILAELWGLKDGSLLAEDRNFLNLEISIDAKAIIELICSANTSSRAYENIIFNCRLGGRGQRFNNYDLRYKERSLLRSHYRGQRQMSTWESHVYEKFKRPAKAIYYHGNISPDQIIRSKLNRKLDVVKMMLPVAAKGWKVINKELFQPTYIGQRLEEVGEASSNK
ncbi:hypothetical protein ACH5RR_039545 [Cinchona calisaya]|uniref:RNase H type-1 domain-containing protein n=1 Tax=Cinchona calisaya TaxID=153742 RepID=A0ABD2Y1Z2_9GENT